MMMETNEEIWGKNLQNNVDVKQDLKSNQSLVIPGERRWKVMGGDHMAFRGGGQRENQSSPTVYKGGGEL